MCYNIAIMEDRVYSTKIARSIQKKEVMSIPSDSRCGSVETCRNAEKR